MKNILKTCRHNFPNSKIVSQGIWQFLKAISKQWCKFHISNECCTIYQLKRNNQGISHVMKALAIVEQGGVSSFPEKSTCN